MTDWVSGYSRSELDQAQERYGVRFPPDLIALLLDRSPAQGYPWNTDDPRIRRMLAWPLEMLLFDVDNGLWWPDWGERPEQPETQREVVRHALSRAPRLIPLLGHRFLPETPNEAGNPVFSIYGFDTIYYGANLVEYFSNEFGGGYEIGRTRHIQFWSNLAEGHDQVLMDDPDAR